jgi:hypothetical protein
MDSGPQNVLGKRPSLVDPLVMEIIAKIEHIIAQPDIEVEARLGVHSMQVGDKKSSTSRILLPITTETILEPSGSCTTQNGKPFKYEFVPDIGKELFEKIKERMESLMQGKFSEAPPNPLFKVKSRTDTHTVDEVYKKPVQCRVSYAWADYGNEDKVPLEVISKENLEKLDIYSGQYPDLDEESSVEQQGGVRHPFDLRISVNKEKKRDATLVSSLNRQDCATVREKRRITYDLKAWVVDMTWVTQRGETCDKFEVEVELKRELLCEQLDRRAKNKPHGVYEILNDFLFFVRDLASVFGPGQDNARLTGGFKYPEMKSCEPPEDLKKKYRDKFGEVVFPIIGEYIFRIIDEVKP